MTTSKFITKCAGCGISLCQDDVRLESKSIICPSCGYDYAKAKEVEKKVPQMEAANVAQ